MELRKRKTNNPPSLNVISPKRSKSGELKKKSSQAQASLNDNHIKQQGSFRIEHFLVDQDWKELLKNEFDKDYFKKLNETLERDYTEGDVKPPKELVFNAFNLTPLNKVCI